MPGLGKTIVSLNRLRQRFEALLRTAGEGSRQQAPSEQSDRLRELTGFGSNPGNLRMFVHVPERLPPSPALVIALHGCTQSAASYNHGAGWSALADQHGFVVVYPEQGRANNPQGCFSWFVPGDTGRDHGETLSIRQMVEHALREFGADRQRAFVTGLSAGGAMTSVMLATYPEVFAGGAIIAGLPFGCADTVEEAFAAMSGARTRQARAWGDRVRRASPHCGPWPKVSVWHGSADAIVKASNAEDIVRQWTNLHGLSAQPSQEDTFAGHSRRAWKDANGETVIEAYTISGMGHGVPLAVGVGTENCGATGPFFLDSGISSSHEIARFWGLSTLDVPKPRVSDDVSSTNHRTPARGEAHALTIDGGGPACEPGTVRVARSTRHDGPRQFDPNAIIAAAFKTAGLPIPDTTESDAHANMVAPGPIITAALKAAGLKP